METLFVLDKQNYSPDAPVIERFGVRALICKDGKWAMQASWDGEYKIPGGGIEAGETFVQALEREVREETGLLVIPDSIKEIGEVIEVRQDVFSPDNKFVAHSYYYFCDVLEEMVETTMTASEIERGYHLKWASLEEILQSNKPFMNQNWMIRDMKFLEWLRNQIKQ